MPRVELFRVVTLSALVSPLAVASACAVAPASERAAPSPAAAADEAELGRALRARTRQSLAFAMADDWCAALGEAADLAQKNASAESRAAAQAMQRNGVAAALAVACGSDPGAAALDLLVLSSLQNWSLRTNPAGNGLARPDAERALARLERAREDLWSRASRELDPKGLADLRLLIDAWVKAHPDETRVSLVRFADFAAERGGLGAKDRDRAAAILASASARASGAEDARLFSERTLWYFSHYPSLLGAQAESSAARIAQASERDAREGRAALADTLGKERAALGEILAAERKAIAAAATTERKAIAGSLGEERAALADALAKERAALAAALGKEREAASADLAREREALVAGVNKAVDASSAAAKAEREALAKWAGEERAAFAEDLEARLVKVVDRAVMGLGIVAGALVVCLAVLKLVPSRKAG